MIIAKIDMKGRGVLIDFSYNRADTSFYNKSFITVDENSSLRDSMFYYVSSLFFIVLLFVIC